MGDLVGYVHIGTGYKHTRIFYKEYMVHILIWIMHNDIVPKGYFVEHKDRIRLNNKIDNLRLATRSQNCANVTKRKGNFGSQYKGVSYDTKKEKWLAHIQKDKKQYFIGLFNSEEDAREAYMIKSIELFGEFAHYD